MRQFVAVSLLWAFVTATIACGSEGGTLLPPSPTLTYITPVPTVTSTPTIQPTVTPTPSPIPTVAPVAIPTSGVSAAANIPTREDILSEISKYPWPIDQAIAVATCESGLTTTAYNPSGATGLFQIMNGSFELEANVAAAYSKYQSGVAMGNPWYHWNQFGPCGHF